MNAIRQIRPPALADEGHEISITDWLNAAGIIRAGWNGQQWNVYLTGNRFATGESIEDALDSIEVPA